MKIPFMEHLNIFSFTISINKTKSIRENIEGLCVLKNHLIEGNPKHAEVLECKTRPRGGGGYLPTPVLKYLLEKNHFSDCYEKLVRVIFQCTLNFDRKIICI